MYKDEIIKEVWQNRDEYAERHHHNLSEIVADLKKRQHLSKHEFVNRRTQKKPYSQTLNCRTKEG